MGKLKKPGMRSLKKVINETETLDIKIKYGGEFIHFNLKDELVINENRINEELKDQPSYYGFLCILRAKLDRVKNDKKLELSKTKSKLFSMYKSRIDTNTNRPYNNDMVDSKVQNHKKYLKVAEEYNKAEEELGIIESCVNAFYQRSMLIQSLSANVRNEKSSL